ncbi:hypothetical protein HY091_03275 [Candidatus Kaiserbacteria bacterium]|nr:hypothetical protein [Candidatus Kaiserbacteria bacterium]
MVDIINASADAQKRADALQTLGRTLVGVDEEVKRRDWAYHALIDTSHSRADWEETAQEIKVARKCGDLRPAVRTKFSAACPHEDLAKSALVDEPPRQKFPPVTAESVFAEMREEKLAKRREARRRKGKSKT